MLDDKPHHRVKENGADAHCGSESNASNCHHEVVAHLKVDATARTMVDDFPKELAPTDEVANVP